MSWNTVNGGRLLLTFVGPGDILVMDLKVQVQVSTTSSRSSTLHSSGQPSPHWPLPSMPVECAVEQHVVPYEIETAEPGPRICRHAAQLSFMMLEYMQLDVFYCAFRLKINTVACI